MNIVNILQQRNIYNSHIPRSHEKPSKLESYDGTRDPSTSDQRSSNVQCVSPYTERNNNEIVQRLRGWLYRFVENLVRGILFTLKARRHQLGLMDALNAIIQGKKEMLREYVEMFTKEGLEVYKENDKPKVKNMSLG